jgi:folylpolyglutamate synthase/dihydropteroate synthase
MTDKLVLTRYSLTTDLGHIKSYDPKKLQSIVLGLKPTLQLEIYNDSKTALSKTMSESSKDSIILVTGSLYLIGEIKKNFQLPITNYQ